MRPPAMDLQSFAAKADAVAQMLRIIGNGRRLMLLCKLVEYGERKVGDLADDVGLTQSATSQHLSRMRAEGILAYRRDGQTLWYRIADPRAKAMLDTLYQLYCQ